MQRQAHYVIAMPMALRFADGPIGVSSLTLTEGVLMAQTPLGIPATCQCVYQARLITLSPETPQRELPTLQLPARAQFTIELPDAAAGTVHFSLVDTEGAEIAIDLELKTRQIIIDRSATGHSDLHERFFPVSRAQLPTEWREITFDILIDHNSVEVFLNEGELSLTVLFFPHLDANLRPRLSLSQPSGEIVIRDLRIERLECYRHKA